MNTKIMILSMVLGSSMLVQSSDGVTAYTRPQTISTASIWRMVTEMQDMLQEAQKLIAILAESVDAIDGKEDELAILVDYVARESARRIDMVFEKAEEIRKQSDARLQEVANYLQFVAVESSRQLQEVMERIAKVGSTVAYYLEGLEQTSTILGTFISQVTDQTDRIETIVAMMSENQARIEAALDRVRENSSVAAQMVFSNYTYYTLLSSQMDVLSSDLEECCTELSENDAKIFSAVDAVDTQLTVMQTTLNAHDAAVNVKLDSLTATCEELNENDAKIFSAIESLDTAMSMRSEKRRERNQGNIRTSTPAQVHFISNTGTEEIRVTEPGLYIVTEALVTTGITIQADNVTLDLNGFTVTSFADVTIPLYVTQSDTVLVKNGTIIGGRGIVVTESCGVTLEKLMVTYPTHHGIQMSGIDTGAISSCAVRNGEYTGIVVDGGSTNILLRETQVCDCRGNGFDLQAKDVVVKDCTAEHNCVHGIAVSNSSNVHLHRAIVDNNKEHGIMVDSTVERVQVESCRVMGNGAIGCFNGDASYATWMNNLASGNGQADYENIKAVAISKATSFWHNVYGS